MPCSQTLIGIAKDCAVNLGGVKRVLAANAADVTNVTVTDNIITAITKSAAFVEFNFRPQTANFASTWQIGDGGAKYVQTLLAMVFSRMETSKRIAVMALAQADAVAIVEDANGKYWYLGKDNPLELNTGDAGTGTARTDRNGYGITLEDNSRELPFEVDASIIDGLLSYQAPET